MRRHAWILLLPGLLVSHAVAATPRDSATPGAEQSIERLTAAARGSVVVITHAGRDGKADGVGAGFVISRDGLIATCLHVIGEGRAIRVEFANGARHEVTEVFASDRKLDLAIVRVTATNLFPLKLGDSDAVTQGASIVALGNPLGLEHSVVSGIVSARREIAGNQMIQIAIPIEPGNSGGPLLDRRGRVQGVLTLKDALSANLGFAMPVNALKKLIEHPNPVPLDKWLRLASLDARVWLPQMGAHWRRKAGAIRVDGIGSGFGGRSICLSQRPAPSLPYEVAVTVRLDDESGAAGLIFAGEGERHYGFYPTAGQMRLTRFDGPNVFSWTILKDFKSPQYRAGDWNIIKVRVETNRIVGFVNGAQVMESDDAALRGTRVGLAKFRQTTADFRDFKVAKQIAELPESVELTAEVKRAAEQGSSLNESVLAKNPDAARRLLLDQARAMETQARDVRTLASTLNAGAVQQELVSLFSASEDKVDLIHAALLVAKLDNPDLDVAPYRSELKRMAAEVNAKLPVKATDAVKLDALTKYLFAESGFHGSRSDFYNRANSYLNDVLDDLEGLPITLSILYIELARSLEVADIAGIPVPTRFMVRHSPKGGAERIIDVFDGGKVLTRSEVVELVGEDAERIAEGDFVPATKRAIIVRMLRNLHGITQRTGQSTDSLRYLDVILTLEPESAVDRLNRARLRLQSGDNAAAKEDVRWL
ncbi:MAG TPA: transglutaminase family protein, partial [Candidatus Acidoferrum sp.]|nr:transglutaminase family protein [Candidatus Acidoferrum sp.]